jgi:hypothetical protein
MTLNLDFVQVLNLNINLFQLTITNQMKKVYNENSILKFEEFKFLNFSKNNYSVEA